LLDFGRLLEVDGEEAVQDGPRQPKLVEGRNARVQRAVFVGLQVCQLDFDLVRRFDEAALHSVIDVVLGAIVPGGGLGRGGRRGGGGGFGGRRNWTRQSRHGDSFCWG